MKFLILSQAWNDCFGRFKSRSAFAGLFISSNRKILHEEKNNPHWVLKKIIFPPLHFRYSSGDIFQVQQFSMDTQQSTESSICTQIIAKSSKLEIGKSFTISFLTDSHFHSHWGLIFSIFQQFCFNFSIY